MATEKLKETDYQALAEFRYQIRCFLRFSEQAARALGLEPQQHQVLLAIKGLSPERAATIGVIAERMQLAHHSIVEMVDRLEEREFVCRRRNETDRRQVTVELTTAGQEILAKLSLPHLKEMGTIGPALVEVLNRFVQKSGFSERKLRLIKNRSAGRQNNG
jgi:DNA-binding MarR family transcriptional regulator